ncbi:MAG: ribonuclease Z [Candidatus Pacearchaeota archaeon]
MAEKVKIHFLGTSDSVPSAGRNHPSIWLSYERENILIDCGEGTQRQIRKARLNPCRITRILITHWHADHILGIPGLLKTLGMSGYNRTLHIYGPRGTKRKLESLRDLFGVREEYPIKVKEVSGKFLEEDDFYIESEEMTHGTPCNAYSFVLKGKTRIDKKKIEKFKIPTGPHMKKLKEGKDITYKGKKYSAKNLTYTEEGKRVSIVLDTALNERIAPFVKESDVFVSESTFDSGHEDKAREYKHLTSEQAARIAKKAKVKKLYLIHVSQRFSKNFKAVLQEAKKVFKETSLPKDLDSVEV